MAIPEIFNIYADSKADNAEIPEVKFNPQPTLADQYWKATTPPSFVQEETPAPAAAPAVTAPPAGASTQEEDFIKMMASVGSRPKPQYDEAKQKSLEAMSSASGVAKALSVLGDAFAVSRGATINPNRVSTETPYINKILADKENYASQMNAFEQQQYLDAIRQASGLQQAKAADYAAGESARRFGISQEQQAARDKESARRFNVTQEQAATDRAATQDYRKEEQRIREENAIRDDAYRVLAAQAKQAGQKFTLYDPNGKATASIDDAGQLQALFSAIINDPSVQSESMARLRLLKGSMEGLSVNNMKSFVQEFWAKSPAAQKLISQGIGSAATQDQSLQDTPAPAGVPSWAGGGVLPQNQGTGIKGKGPLRPEELDKQGTQPAGGANQPHFVAGIDVSPWATAPQHEAAMDSTYTSLTKQIDTSVKDKPTLVKSIDDYISSYSDGKSPLVGKGEAIVDIATKYNVDPNLLISIMQVDSSLGQAGKAVDTKNPGNFGNDDAGNTKTFGTWEEGIEAIAKQLSLYRDGKSAHGTPSETGKGIWAPGLTADEVSGTTTPAQETPKSAGATDLKAQLRQAKTDDEKKKLLLDAGYPQEQVDAYFGKKTQTTEVKYPPSVQEMFNVKILLPNKAPEIAAAMADEQGLTGEEAQAYMNKILPQVKADIAAERERRKTASAKGFRERVKADYENKFKE